MKKKWGKKVPPEFSNNRQQSLVVLSMFLMDMFENLKYIKLYKPQLYIAKSH